MDKTNEEKWLLDFINYLISIGTDKDFFNEGSSVKVKLYFEKEFNSFIAAKTSSYEREQFLVKQRDLISDAANRVGEINQKLQKKIKELESKNYEVESGNFDTAVAKRDQLIEQVYKFENTFDNDEHYFWSKWLKQVDELKEGK